jgi:hypothetical protein
MAILVAAGGAALGTALGVGPGAGWLAGAALGNLLFPTQGPESRVEGPRLGDLKQMSTPMPYRWRHFQGGMDIALLDGQLLRLVARRQQLLEGLNTVLQLCGGLPSAGELIQISRRPPQRQ